MKVSDALKALEQRVLHESSSLETQLKASIFMVILTQGIEDKKYTDHFDLVGTFMGGRINEFFDSLPDLPMGISETKWVDPTDPEFNNTVDRISTQLYESAMLNEEDDLMPLIQDIQKLLKQHSMPQNTEELNNNNNNNQRKQHEGHATKSAYMPSRPQKPDHQLDLLKQAVHKSYVEKQKNNPKK